MELELTDLELLVSFLSTWLSKSDEDDWKELKRGLVWVKNTVKYKRLIGEISISKVFTCIYV